MIRLNTDRQDVNRALKDAVTKRQNAGQESIDDAFARLRTSCKWTEREGEYYRVALAAWRAGEIGAAEINPTGRKKLTKSDIINAGRRVIELREEKAREERIADTLRTKPDNYHIITEDSGLSTMMDRLREEVRLQRNDPWFRKVFDLFNNTDIRRKLADRGVKIPAAVSITVWDTETSGLDKMIDLSGGYSVWLPILNEGYYVAYGHVTGEKQCTRSKALGAIARFMSLPAHIKSFHNAPYDLHILRNDGLNPAGVRYDSQDVQKSILYDHEESYGLKQLFAKYKRLIGPEAEELDDYTFEDLFGSGSPLDKKIEVVGTYAIKDVHKGWLLTRWQIEMMIKKDLARPYFEIRQYLPEINVEIERTGFDINLAELSRLGEEYRKKLEEANHELIEAYQIDVDFLYEMSMALKGDRIREWCVKQRERIEKRAEMLADCRAELERTNPATKKYAQLQKRIARYESEPLPEPIPQNAPDYIHEFNLSSNDHLAYLIYDKLGIRDRTKEIVKDKSKNRAVSKDVLERYFEEEPALAPLAKVSLYEKLLGTYIEKIPEALDVDGRLHTELNTVSTGRYSSKGYTGKPNNLRPADINDDNFLDVIRTLIEHGDKSVMKGTNLQNIPSRNAEGVAVRMCFVPPEGYTFIGSDLSSIEPRIQAHRMAAEFGDESFAEMYRKGLDPYVEFAALLFDVDRELCTEQAYKDGLVSVPYRALTKDMFLAKGYGQAEEMFVKTAVKRGVSEEAAARAYARFDEILPGFSTMVQATFEHLRKHGWTATLWGQKRRFPEYRENWRELCRLMKKAGIADKNDPELAGKTYKLTAKERTRFWELIRKTGRDERAAFNHTIQGTGANVLQLCMIRSYYECTLTRGWKFVLTLHDEQKHAIPNDQLTPEAVDLYDDIMTNTVSLAVPIKCDTVIEPRWMEEYSRDEWDFENCKPKED